MTIKGRDGRPTLTLKGEGFTPEFRALLNKAAKKAGKTQAEFATEALAAASRRILSGNNPEDNPTDNPPLPATVQQLEAMQAAFKATDAKADDTARALQQLSEQVKRLAEVHERPRLWDRLRGR